jgi:hypothetical protein
MHSWRFAEMHKVTFNDGDSFPSQIETVNDLAPILDTMQENRFEKFMEELGGLSDEDLDLFLGALVQSFIFQKTYMPGVRPRLPITTLFASFIRPVV